MSSFDTSFLETYILSLVAFFATVGPINVLIIFMSLTATINSEERRKIAKSATIISASILFSTMFFGAYIFKYLGVDLASVKVAGGILILITAIGMIFGEDKEAVEESDIKKKKDIAVFPLSVPIIAGPAAITTSMLFFNTYQEIMLKLAVVLGLVTNIIAMILLLLFSDKIMHKLNKSILAILLRIVGLILASLAVQFIFDGIKQVQIFVN